MVHCQVPSETGISQEQNTNHPASCGDTIMGEPDIGQSTPKCSVRQQSVLWEEVGYEVLGGTRGLGDIQEFQNGQETAVGRLAPEGIQR